jgi:hypothetical protein
MVVGRAREEVGRSFSRRRVRFPLVWLIASARLLLDSRGGSAIEWALVGRRESRASASFCSLVAGARVFR